MKKTYVLITLASVLIISIIAFILNSTPNPTTANNQEYIRPTQARFNLDTNEMKAITYISEDEEIRYYLFEEEITKILNTKEYKELKNWKIRIFSEPIHKETKNMLTEDVKNLLEIQNNSKIDLWAVAFDLEYNHQNQTVASYALYVYNQEGNILGGAGRGDWITPERKTSVNKTDPQKDPLFSILSQYVNEYLEKRARESQKQI